ncbi:MAG: hypothetical protein CMG00_08295 [Candidatus Marinimicrobia bacterium]|nr:hypothetical protein [Candidatus Neomarinimicrobiota bacterium]
MGESKKSVLKHKELSLSNWVLTLFIASLPLVGFVMLFVWSFSDNPHPVRSKWAKATLILMGIGILIALFLILIMASFASSAVVRYY